MSKFGSAGKRRYEPPMFDRHGPYYDEFYPPPSRFARGFGSFMPHPSPFLERAMVDDYPRRPPPFRGRTMVDYRPAGPSKEEVLMDLGETLIQSLKEGRNLAHNPVVREKMETLLKVEAEETAVPLVPPPRGPYNRYDAYYEDDFPQIEQPGASFTWAPPMAANTVAPVGKGFPSTLPPAVIETNTSNENRWFKFLRVGKEEDFHRIYATEGEISMYFALSKASKPLNFDEQLLTRLRNTFSYEISRNKLPNRHNWLLIHHDKIAKKAGIPLRPKPAPTNASHPGPVKTPANPPVQTQAKARVAAPGQASVLTPAKIRQIEKKEAFFRKKRPNDGSLTAKQKKALRDKRPVQTETERRITNYLKMLLFELCGPENKEHAVLVLRAIHTNPRMIKCLMRECHTWLDKKFGAGTSLVVTNQKRSFLIAFERTHIEETRKHMLSKGRSIKRVMDDSIYQESQALLSGKKINPEAFGSPEDYILEPGKSNEEFVVDFKYEFVRCAFEKFYFKIVETFCVTKDRRKLINFFMNNGFVALMVVLEAQGKFVELPSVVKKYITTMDKPCKDAALRVDASLLEKVRRKENFEVRTSVEDFCSKRTDITLDMIEQFKACLAVFDPKASVIKSELVDYTPYNPLSRDYKLYVFNEIMKFLYLQCLENIIHNVNPMYKHYTDMQKD